MKKLFSLALGTAILVLCISDFAYARPWKICLDAGDKIEVLIKPDYLDDALLQGTLIQMGFNIGIPGVQSAPNSKTSTLKISTYRLVQNNLVMSLRAYLWPQESGMGAIEGDTYPMGRNLNFVLSRNYDFAKVTMSRDGKPSEYKLGCKWLN